MRAKFSTPCMCGARVNPGDRIEFDHVSRRVVLCPSCAPSSRKTHRIGAYVPCGDGLAVASIRSKATGAVDAIAFRHLAADAALVSGVYKRDADGAWRFSHSIGYGDMMDTPSGISPDRVRRYLAAAADRYRAEKAAA